MTSLQRIRAQNSLASNEQLVITGTSGGEAANRMLLANAALRDHAKKINSIKQDDRNAILSEIAVAAGKADVRLMLGSDDSFYKV